MKRTPRVSGAEYADWQEEEARRQRQERRQQFLPATRRSLERLEALAGARLAEELAEAIRSELAHARVTGDLAAEPITGAA